ncbi:hypothetical protein BJ508DRAFT_314892 [Ascobolus immersus RN42]|uniref:Uncharacterized protein n=1 Tax=Ascobolus immersus RN42 TaxID=1160509 RepID=A0A3N4HDC2_ASCIM|nr:hypothetical protein BJ508DRAFT_314892 [Ascobolus immersus RN42]
MVPCLRHNWKRSAISAEAYTAGKTNEHTRQVASGATEKENKRDRHGQQDTEGGSSGATKELLPPETKETPPTTALCELEYQERQTRSITRLRDLTARNEGDQKSSKSTKRTRSGKCTTTDETPVPKKSKTLLKSSASCEGYQKENRAGQVRISRAQLPRNRVACGPQKLATRDPKISSKEQAETLIENVPIFCEVQDPHAEKKIIIAEREEGCHSGLENAPQAAKCSGRRELRRENGVMELKHSVTCSLEPVRLVPWVPPIVRERDLKDAFCHRVRESWSDARRRSEPVEKEWRISKMEEWKQDGLGSR